MANSEEFLSFLIDQCSGAGHLSARAMFGAYTLYMDGKILGIVGDGQFFLRATPAGLRLLPDAPLMPPYPGAKACILVEELEDREFLTALLQAVWPELPEKKKRK